MGIALVGKEIAEADVISVLRKMADAIEKGTLVPVDCSVRQYIDAEGEIEELSVKAQMSPLFWQRRHSDVR